jgi:hypothetical protein
MLPRMSRRSIFAFRVKAGIKFSGLFFRFGPKADYGKPYLLVKLPSLWPSKQYYQGMLVRRMVHK